MTDLSLLPDRLIVALTIWGESRGEPIEGQIAVGNVIRNRHKPGQSWSEICLAPFQFSCFNSDSPEYAKVQRAADTLTTQALPPDLSQALWVADGIIQQKLLDNTGGATHYLTASLYRSDPPTWAATGSGLRTIGSQVFMKAA